MDHSKPDRKRNQRCVNYSSVVEPEYDVVDDQEEMINVHILPARPMNDEREYADRDLPRSKSAQSLSSLSTGISNNVLRCPPREFPHAKGPAINRDLKPGRKKTRLERFTTVQSGDQCTRRCPESPPFTLELVNHLPGLSLQDPCRREKQQKASLSAEFGVHSKGLQRVESLSNQRHSLDLDSHVIEQRLQQSLERVPSKRHHHEWPQTKEDINQHEFVPKEKPQQTYCEEDWYVGPCNRTDADHALHLMNKDGAFLVRDCSLSSSSEPLVLAVYHEKKVYNVKIRFIESTRKYALGRSNDMFDSVAEIIRFHSIFPIILISGRNLTGNKYPENCVLTFAVTRKDVNQLLQ